MHKKILYFLEKYVDKLILGVLAIATLAVLWFFVIANPYGKEYARRVLGPGEIDEVINKNAKMLDQKIDDGLTIDPLVYNSNRSAKFAGNIRSSINIDESIVIPIPPKGIAKMDEKRVYRKPDIPPVHDVAAENIRTAYYVPTEDIDSSLTYAQAKTEVEDFDLVSVQGAFDVSELFRNFKNSFDSSSVPAAYRDAQLSVPVFAAVSLERQKLDKDGNWTQWKTVGPLKINHRKEMFDVPEEITDYDLEDVDLLMTLFDKFEVQRDLLQPLPYDIAASNEEWLTPELHRELDEILEKQKEEEQRKSSGRTRPTAGRTDMMYDGMMTGRGRDTRGSSRRMSRIRERQRERQRQQEERTADIVREDYELLLLTEDTELAEMEEPLVVWTHDDNVKVSNTYRYRMRVGIFNPAAGKDWYKGSDTEFNNKVILWSDYSEKTEPIEIDPMVHLFPLNVARGEEKAVIIQVSKFYNGKWQSAEFDVAVGETIGKVIEVEETRDAMDIGMEAMYTGRRGREETQTIDYTTGAVLVDIVEVRRRIAGGRPYREILYSKDTEEILHQAINKRNWTKEKKSAFSTIEEQQDMEVRILPRSQSGTRRRSTTPRPGGENFEDYERMMMEMGGFGG